MPSLGGVQRAGTDDGGVWPVDDAVNQACQFLGAEARDSSGHRARLALEHVDDRELGRRRGPLGNSAMITRGDLAAAIARALDVDVASVPQLRKGSDEPWDSVGHIEVILTTEEVIGAPLCEEDLPLIASLDDLVIAARKVADVA